MNSVKYVKPWEIGALFVYLTVVTVIVLAIAVREWPSTLPIAPHEKPELRYLVLAALGGAFGGCIRALNSLASFAGNRLISRGWLVWYLLEPLVGLVSGVLFYFLVRGGLLLSADSLNPIGIVAVSGLAGLFGRASIQKLNEVFVTLFTQK